MKQLGVVVPIVTPCTLAGEPVLEELALVFGHLKRSTNSAQPGVSLSKTARMNVLAVIQE